MECYKDSFRKKRYGQYFSGRKVSELLVSLLPENTPYRTIIDPMAGDGDLLIAAQKAYPEAEKLLGIDIDNETYEPCKARLRKATVIIGDAFKSSEISGSDGWDLVITNPPYVRYQTLKTNGEIGLPNGDEIRKNLISSISASALLGEGEKEFFSEIAKIYSGLSDMAVPAWILCASIVKAGGILAMVVPETWLNREYALPIHYMLLRCFDILVIAKDVQSAWFENAEVRTCLVVARRKKISSISDSYDRTVCIELCSGLVDRDSLVGKLSYKGKKKYDALEQLLREDSNIECTLFSKRIISSTVLFAGLMNDLPALSWVKEEDRIHVDENYRLPEELQRILKPNDKIRFITLEDIGWHLGQGLRTGANDFFYATVVSATAIETVLQTEKWHDKIIPIESENIKITLKNRNEVQDLVVDIYNLKKAIFYIQKQVRAKDWEKLAPACKSEFSVMNHELDDYISAAGNYKPANGQKMFRELSAVKPNERRTPLGYTRFWYMLPALRERHMPNICISRICSNCMEALYLNQDGKNEVVVDANFITLWHSEASSQMAAFAMLNSSWARCYIELIGTIMGGGALKIEASQLRKIRFPRLEEKSRKRLEEAGRKLAFLRTMDDALQDEIDSILVSPFDAQEQGKIVQYLRNLLRKKIRERTQR